jgi:hypothetical protein
MALITTPGDRNSDSYVTVNEADSYIHSYYGSGSPFVESTWNALSEDAKEHRLRLAALFLEDFGYRGKKACRDQFLAFPRWWKTDWNYPAYEDQYITMSDIPGYGDGSPAYEGTPDDQNLFGSPPAVPDNVKNAQIEVAYRVLHSTLLSGDAGAMDVPEQMVKSFSLGGGMAIDFFQTSADQTTWSKAKMTSMKIVEAYLNKWIRSVSGGAV